MEGDPPIESVATEIDQPTSPIGEGLQRIEHRLRMVLGVRPSDDHRILRQEREAFVMQHFIRNHVVYVSTSLEPIDDVRIGVVLMKARRGRPPQNWYFGRMLTIGRKREE